MIICAAVIGGTTRHPSENPNSPLTAEECAHEAITACKAGAAIVHIHARDIKGDSERAYSTGDLEIQLDICRRIKDECDAVICLSTGGGWAAEDIGTQLITRADEKKLNNILTIKPELATFHVSSWNRYVPSPPWPKHVKNMARINTLEFVEKQAKIFQRCDTKPYIEIFDAGFLNTVAALVDEGALKQPLHLEFTLGMPGTMGPPTPESLLFLVGQAERLLPKKSFTWSVVGWNDPTYSMTAMAAILGGHSRVGFEDCVYIKKGTLAKSNAQIVKKTVRIAKLLGRRIVGPNEARTMLGLKGKEKVVF